MFDFLSGFSPFALVLIATSFTWGVTALGAAMVFFFKKVNRAVLDIMMGFSAGVMIAASFWSLLSPAVELSSELGYTPWLFPALGFLVGGMFVVGASKLLDFALNMRAEKRANSAATNLVDGILIDPVEPSQTSLSTRRNKKNMPIQRYTSSSLKRSILLVSSITLHNIPEGLSVGVAFGAMALGIPGCEIVGAALLAIGIGIQNFPEGASVSLPLRREGFSRGKAFFYGQASGFVEPLAAILGFFLATSMRAILPFALSFSAGAMIAVVAGELIPESTLKNKNLAVIGCIIGFLLMMILDVALA